jgi:hypothetical protein
LPDDNQSDTRAPVLLEVERFEQALAGAERVVLRVDGRYAERPGKRVLDARLFVDDGLAVHRHAPLADPADPADGWLWRAAFEVPASYLTDARTRFALESEPGSLIDLPRPAELQRGASSVPVTARAAHLARRYAAAVAVVLTVAVAPGALPSQARTEVLRVHHADGSVVYVTSDGRTLAALPADAVVIDQPAPAPVPEPPAEPAAAPAPEPQPAPSMQAADGDAKAAPTEDGTKDDHARGLSGLAGEARDAVPSDGGSASRPNHGEDRKLGNSSTGGESGAAPDQPRTAGDGAASDRGASDRTGERSADTGSKRIPAAAGDFHPNPGKPVTPLDTIAGLVTQDVPSTVAGLPALVATNDAQSLQQPADPSGDLPTKSLEPLGSLSGGPAHGSAPGDASTGGTAATHDSVPSMDGVPGLFTPPQAPVTPTTPTTPPADRPANPSPRHGAAQPHSGSRRAAPAPEHEERTTGGHSPSPVSGGSPSTGTSPAPSGGTTNGGYFDSLPGPGHVDGVPNFVIQKFHVPPFLLSIYQAAGIQYGIRWEVLAAINEIETDYGRNLNVSSAGALGWMQFMPATWRQYGVDANKDGKRDPYNPVDAIFAAARYLKAAGAQDDIRRAIFAYNHAGWYVDSVMLRARLIAGYPPDLIGSLTGLTEGRFPVAARARYADDLSTRTKQVAAGQNAANIIDSSATRRGIDIHSKPGAPVIAVNDGVIKEIGRSKKKGRYVVLQDVYGNRYTYSQLGSLAHLYPVPKTEAKAGSKHFEPVGASDPTPHAPASAGTQRPGSQKVRKTAAKKKVQTRVAAVKERLFAHPARPASKPHGGLDQLLAHIPGSYDNYFSKPLGLNSKNATLKRLRKGSHVVGSTILGRVGKTQPRIHFEVQPAGKGAPKIDPKPILDGWKLLESTAIYRSKGRNVLYGDGEFSIGEIMLLPKPLLVKRVLSDPRIKLDASGRQDIATGQIDRRVLVVLEYLAESGLEPTVSSLKSDHGVMTTSGNVSEHSSGSAVDIAAINGVPITGHQGAGDVTEQAVRRLMQLQGTVEPHQIISLLDFGRNTLALGDHDDHIHVGFHPLFGENEKLGRETQSVLKPDQWDSLVQRLGEIPNPTVPTQPSKYAIPDSNGQGE